MATRTTQVFLHNDTPFWLTTPVPELVHGEWGRKGQQAPSKTIAPHTVGEMGSDSDGVLTGTEAGVTYVIEDGKESFVSIHWKNPFISNFDQGNTYREVVSNGFELTHSGGSGNHAVVHFFLAVSIPHRIAHFLPSTSGFLFANGDFATQGINLPVIALPPPLDGIEITNSSNGMCGGMIFAARDYWEAGLIPPATNKPPSQENDLLFQYLRDRLYASWDVTRTGHDYFVFMSPAYPDTDQELLSSLGVTEGRSFAMVMDEWPEIKIHIDNGEPTPVALVRIKSASPADVGHNHQVLAYGYEVNGANVTLHVYDPNYPNNDTVKLTFNKERTDVPILVSYTIDGAEDRTPVYCFFRINYERSTPPLGRPKGSMRYNISLRKFFSTTGFDPAQGVRVLQPGVPTISLKSLVGL